MSESDPVLKEVLAEVRETRGDIREMRAAQSLLHGEVKANSAWIHEKNGAISRFFSDQTEERRELREDLAAIMKKVDKLCDECLTREEHERLSIRVDEIEKTIPTGDRITSLSEQITGIKTVTDGIASRVTHVETEMSEGRGRRKILVALWILVAGIISSAITIGGQAFMKQITN